MKKSLIVLLSGTLLLALGMGLLKWNEARKPIADIDLEPVRVDASTHVLEADLTLTLREDSKDTVVSVETTMGENTDATELAVEGDGHYTGRLSFPLDQRGACAVEAIITRDGTTRRETLRTYEDIFSLLPVRVQRCWRVGPKYQEGSLGLHNGALTTRVYDLNVAGMEGGSGAVELRGYCGGALVRVVPGEWDPDSGLYSTGDLEVPCKAEDTVRITLLCQDADGVAYEFTTGRWKITTSGKVEEVPERKQDSYPVLTWPE